MTRPGALLEELGVARHQVGQEALGLLGEALAARGRRGAVGAAPLGPRAPGAAPAPPQPDLAHRALEELPRVVVQRGRRLDVLAAQGPCQVPALCGRGPVEAPAGCTGPGAGRGGVAVGRGGGGGAVPRVQQKGVAAGESQRRTRQGSRRGRWWCQGEERKGPWRRGEA